MKVLSLFDGIACGRLALQRANLPVDKYYSSEIDEYAIKVATNNFADIIEIGDVNNLDFNNYKNIDLLIGGSPCTYWSRVKTDGKRETTCNGNGWELFRKYKEAFDIIKPKYFLFENNVSISKDIKDAITTELGVDYVIINSADVSAQNRKRCYWTNICTWIQPRDVFLCDILEKDRKDWRPIGNWVYGSWNKEKYNPKINGLKDINSLKSATCNTKKMHPQNYILNADHTMYSNLTINEYEQLQTLPIDYTKGIKESERYKCVGNGWTVDVVANIFENIKMMED